MGTDVDLFIPHQANKRIIEATGERCGIPKDKVMINIDKYGNTTAGTIPIALNEAVEKNLISVKMSNTFNASIGYVVSVLISSSKCQIFDDKTGFNLS